MLLQRINMVTPKLIMNGFQIGRGGDCEKKSVNKILL